MSDAQIETVDRLASELLDAVLDDDPVTASILGLPGHDDRLPDFSLEAEHQSAARFSDITGRAGNIATSSLSEIERQTLDFVRHTASVYGDVANIPLLEWTIGDFHGAPVAGVLTLLPQLGLDSESRKSGYLERLSQLPALLETATERHVAGPSNGRPAVARLVRASIAQLEVIIGDRALGGLIRNCPADVDFARSQAQLHSDVLLPALTRYRDALEEVILPSARDDEHPGLCYITDGPSYYQALCKQHTSTDSSAEDLHRTGLSIARATCDELGVVAARLWGERSLEEIFERMRSSPELRYDNSEQILVAATQAVRRAELAAPRWFATVADAPCEIEVVPEAQQAGSAPAYYIPGAIDGSRRGTFFINASQPHERLRHMAETTAFHEAVPGHHLQISIGLQEQSLPVSRRIIRDTACSEGWGLYSERLADEMGLYSGDVARLGMLAADAWRAGRLVVDTGLHALGWSRDQAVQWMLANTPLGRVEVESEIDRYITFPAQALSYMVGRLEIENCRAVATEQLGAQFDLRSFHDFVLRAGALPLTALSGAVRRWIKANQTD